jgi:hypothetical protein
MSLPIHAILAPQGAEYKAVCQGLNCAAVSSPPVLPIPAGPEPLTKHLERLHKTEQLVFHKQLRVLLMGLCGSLTSNYSIGDIVLYKSCVYQTHQPALLSHLCDLDLNSLIERKLKITYSVKALTSDRLIWSANEKRQLGQQYGADVVDMEGFATLEVLNQAGVAVAMVRVISDDCHYDLPDLTAAISPDGFLQPLPLAMGMLRQPLAATRLIQGSLQGLRVLQKVTTHLFTA